VTLGGGDIDNCTRNVLEALAVIEELTTTAIVGPNNPRVPELEQLAERTSGRITIRRKPQDMPQLMAWADIAVFGAGNHLLGDGVHGPAHALVILAENQRSNATCLDKLGAAANLGWRGELSEKKVRAAVMNILDDPVLRASMS
jgi:spore coat polysaccharide biosynthesis predicted glycosyltransferase SpsG